MNQPTKEQLQWFWEQCGFVYEKSQTRSIDIRARWTAPDGYITDELPSIDLNNLFKYTVPKLIPQLYEGSEVFEVYYYFGSWRARLTFDAEKYYWAEADDPALALFWAIYSALMDDTTKRQFRMARCAQKMGDRITEADKVYQEAKEKIENILRQPIKIDLLNIHKFRDVKCQKDKRIDQILNLKANGWKIAIIKNSPPLAEQVAHHPSFVH